MIEVAEELVESMRRRQMLVPVAQVVLAELPGGVTLLLQQVGNRRGPIRQRRGRCRACRSSAAGAERVLTQDEGRPPGGATLLGVGVREHRPFAGDPIDVRRLVPHDPMVVGTDVVDADVVTPDDEDVRLLLLRRRDVAAVARPTRASAAIISGPRRGANISC